MANFIKIIFFLIIVGGIGIYFLSQSPKIFQGSPQEKVSAPSQTFVSPAPTSYTSPSLSPAPQAISDYLIPSGFSRGQLSPYFEKINISASYAYSHFNPSEIKLSSNLSDNEKVNITGWQIKTNNGEIIIPQAINVYEPSGLFPQQDIVLSGNNYVNIYLSVNPINKNFRLNNCIGYLQNDYVFSPSLPQNCPTPSRSEISYLSGQCQSYILSLWGCKVPDKDSDSFYVSIGGSSEEEVECRAFLDTIDQNGCFRKHRFDSDFLSNEWRLWIREHILDSQHDRVLLFDKQGLLVDEYTY
ncbi:hypothetical protein AUJ30_00545 [Candidatus Wolfebacteria bacterium CG1_02_39_135]|uniref:LTD domain-containing protein n=2 Tax=Candidatus Wolfeibacteriota TaxID=1752735 RepID=A0A2M7B763_9BACT|nr:hypothetical protein [Parcubacteria group bacterium]NCO89295.1 hypothetical protein [Candidatus Wolfebacteria bacterium]OIO65725.1 MAG: hypothetical protein AUJ30_00545 [Candidatus Wolfebacteria bacterium CG1_02_39_135]PIU98919.1 MAG: hypothetical protein COS60_00470 [Candidatus Wolfebacteria bacterium CG03_land_8_20_14_0_80_39_317]NCP58657.1 hypothetical protein [Candidatus Wolfebacteria bacterium]